jgi:hypothetical protein
MPLGTAISYSPTTGSSWRTPLAVPLPVGPNDDLVAAGVGAGSAVLAYSADSGGQAHEYVVPVSYAALAGGR